MYWGEHPIASSWFSNHIPDMQANQLSLNFNQKPFQAQKATVSGVLIRSKQVSLASEQAIVCQAGNFYENHGSGLGYEVKPWLEAGARLFGGVERESQMHPGSSLFITEH
jgi:hypothetical protein